jgi:uncharacterized protein (DUF4415 family)
MNTDTKRRARGKSKKPALFCTSLRIPKEVMDYFNANFPYTKQAKMREILTDFVNNNGVNDDRKN